jgi:signal transduction histidine kinase
MVYSTWQYALIIHIVTVLIIAVLRVRAENRTLVRKQQLARELQIEREASFHQRQFMGMVAHEFRTPLAILQAALENLRLCPATVTQSSRLDRMQRATTRLVQLTDNCLADARLSSRDLHADKQDAELLPVIHMAATVVDLSLNHYLNVTLEGQTVGPDSPSPVLFIDSGLLCIAIANLLDNSVKYAAAGEIRSRFISRKSTWNYALAIAVPASRRNRSSIFSSAIGAAKRTPQRRPGPVLGCMSPDKSSRLTAGTCGWQKHSAGCEFALTLPLTDSRRTNHDITRRYHRR